MRLGGRSGGKLIFPQPTETVGTFLGIEYIVEHQTEVFIILAGCLAKHGCSVCQRNIWITFHPLKVRREFANAERGTMEAFSLFSTTLNLTNVFCIGIFWAFDKLGCANFRGGPN